MPRHIIIAFVIMAIRRVSIRREALHDGFDIHPHRWVSVFGDDERRTSVLDKHIADADLYTAFRDQAIHLIGDFVGAAAFGGVGEGVLVAHVLRLTANA